MNSGCGCRVQLLKYSLCRQLAFVDFCRREDGLRFCRLWGALCFTRPLFWFVFCTEQERKQRAELLEGLRSEKRRLQQVHEAELKAVQAELEGRLAALQVRHREKVSGTPARRLLALGCSRDASVRLSQRGVTRTAALAPFLFCTGSEELVPFSL